MLYIERDDFMEDPPRKFFRLAPGREIRLRYAYFITCNEVVKDEAGNVVELRCTYDPESRGGDAPDGRKVKGTLHWVSARHAVDAEVRLYDHLFTRTLPRRRGRRFHGQSQSRFAGSRCGPSWSPAWPRSRAEDRCQFMRQGYFCVDLKDSKPGALVFNRTTTLKDSWAKLEAQGKRGGGEFAGSCRVLGIPPCRRPFFYRPLSFSARIRKMSCRAGLSGSSSSPRRKEGWPLVYCPAIIKASPSPRGRSRLFPG